jgi:S1-C subfamily serine protease
VGDQVVAIGNALALPGGPTVTTVIVSALDRTIGTGSRRLEHLIQTDVAINPGNSGGPLVNTNAEVVGINTAVIQASNQGDAQNIGSIRPMIEDLRQLGGKVKVPAYLGVSTTTLNDANRERLAGTAAYVTSVSPGTPAEAAGLSGDVIVAVGPDKVASSDELGAAIRKNKPGDKVEVRWQRAGVQPPGEGAIPWRHGPGTRRARGSPTAARARPGRVPRPGRTALAGGLRLRRPQHDRGAQPAHPGPAPAPAAARSPVPPEPGARRP